MMSDQQNNFETRSLIFESKKPNTWLLSRFDEIADVTDYVANGSFASLRENVQYKDEKDFAVLVRLTDSTKAWSGDYVYVSESAYRFLAKSSLVPGDIIIANVGNPGQVFRIPDLKQPMTLGPNAVLVKPRPGIDKAYIAYFFMSAWGQDLIRTITTGTAQKKFNKTGLRSTIVPVVPFPEQQRIASKIEELFSDIDAGEANLRKAQRLLATYRQAVLKAAVTGELTREWREANEGHFESGATVLERILQARREQWRGRSVYKEPQAPDTTTLPNLPSGWCWATPEQLAANEPNALCIGPFGSNLKVEDYRTFGVPLVFVRHIRAKDFDGLKPQYISPEKAQELSSHKVRGGDLLITKMGEPPGDVCIYPEGREEAIITADCIKFSSDRNNLSLSYLEQALQSQIVQGQIQQITKGVAQQKVTLANFKHIALPIPSRQEQEQIASCIDDIFSRIDTLEAWCRTELARSATLRQAILKAAFSGQLVPQDPDDEPAQVFLDHIRTERNAQLTTKQGRVAAAEQLGLL